MTGEVFNAYKMNNREIDEPLVFDWDSLYGYTSYDGNSDNYSSLKGVWLTYLYHVFDEGYGDTEISPARINLFINHHSSYMAGEMRFPRWEFRKLMQGEKQCISFRGI